MYIEGDTEEASARQVSGCLLAVIEGPLMDAG
jgi:cobalamin-dependent methionine synthase I